MTQSLNLKRPALDQAFSSYAQTKKKSIFSIFIFLLRGIETVTDLHTVRTLLSSV